MVSEKKAMTKTQVVTHMAEKFEIPKKTISLMLEELAALAAKETKRIGTFSIPGIGKLTKTRRKARIGRNPATGEQIKIPAKTVVKMRISKVCKEAIIPTGKK